MRLHLGRLRTTVTDGLWRLNALNDPSIKAMQEELSARPLGAKFGDFVERVMNRQRH